MAKDLNLGPAPAPAREQLLGHESSVDTGDGVVTLYGQNFTRNQLLRHVGDVSQVGGIELLELGDGSERGSRAAVFRTGSGFEFTVLPDRGLDIAHASFRGIPMGWISPTGRTAPAFYDSGGLEWLRGFYGGLLVTCGLTYAGAPCVDEGAELGLHGRASNIPAKRLCLEEHWSGDEYDMVLSGEVSEAKVFQPTITMRREIASRLGESRLWIKDTVENVGFARSPHMIVYHINIGFPIVEDGSRLICHSKSVKPRDEDARVGLSDWAVFSGPVKDYREQVFYHDMAPDASGMVNVGIVNDARKIGVKVSYRKDQLPRFIEWKMMGEGTYVVGLEPANCWVEGREKERKRGTLQFLEPEENRSYELEIAFLEGKDAAEFAFPAA